MALAGKVNYELSSPVKIMAGDDDTGVVFNVRSMKCRAARDVLRDIRTRGAEKRLAEGDDDDGGVDLAGITEDDMARIYVACVASWDWNGETFRETDPANPELTEEFCLEIFQSDDGLFIYEQVIEAVADLGKPKAASKKKR